MFWSKKVPPFVVPATDWAITESMAVSAWNANVAKQAHDDLDFIEKNNKLPTNYSRSGFILGWGGFDHLRNVGATFFSKFNKKNVTSLQHSFVMASGVLYAIDSKKRHRVVNPQANGLLGNGTYGKVKLAQNQQAQLFALKVQKAEFSEQPGVYNEVAGNTFRRAANIAKKLGLLIDGVKIGNKFYEILRYFKGPNLGRHIDSKPQDLAVRSICLRCAWAVKDYHDRNIVHGDIKHNNFVFVEANVNSPIALIDTDTSWDLSDPNNAQNLPHYLHISNPLSAPEANDGNAVLTKPADIYQLGRMFERGLFNYNQMQLTSRMTERRPEERLTIEAVIRELQLIGDKYRKENGLFYGLMAAALTPISVYTAFAFYAPLAFIAVGAWVGVGFFYQRNKFQMQAFQELLAQEQDPHAIHPDLLNRLQQHQTNRLAFEAGYQSQTQSMTESLSNWFSLGNYSKSFYAGQRWHQLSPNRIDNTVAVQPPPAQPLSRSSEPTRDSRVAP